MRKHFLGIVLCGIILFLGAAGCMWVIVHLSEQKNVEILQNGELLFTIDLAVAEDRIFDIASPKGVNQIQIQNGAISIYSADCPDQSCVQMGVLSETGLPIVCLPHRLVIQYTTEIKTDSATG